MRDKFNVLGETEKKYKTFSVPIEKEPTNIDIDGNESVVTISHETKFVNVGSMATY